MVGGRMACMWGGRGMGGSLLPTGVTPPPAPVRAGALFIWSQAGLLCLLVGDGSLV